MSFIYFFYIFAAFFINSIVDKLKEYRIAFRGLKEGKHNFDFLMDDDFFNCFPATEGTEGKVKADVIFIKSPLINEVKINIEGYVKAICDRCLGELDLAIEGSMELFVKISEREEGNDDDYIVLSPEDDYIEFGNILYEAYMLNYPIKVVHEEGGCDKEMSEYLEDYLQSENDNDEKNIDPRWDELKKLINN